MPIIAPPVELSRFAGTEELAPIIRADFFSKASREKKGPVLFLTVSKSPSLSMKYSAAKRRTLRAREEFLRESAFGAIELIPDEAALSEHFRKFLERALSELSIDYMSIDSEKTPLAPIVSEYFLKSPYSTEVSETRLFCKNCSAFPVRDVYISIFLLAPKRSVRYHLRHSASCAGIDSHPSLGIFLFRGCCKRARVLRKRFRNGIRNDFRIDELRNRSIPFSFPEYYFFWGFWVNFPFLQFYPKPLLAQFAVILGFKTHASEHIWFRISFEFRKGVTGAIWNALWRTCFSIIAIPSVMRSSFKYISH